MAFSIFCLRLVHQSYFTLVLCLDAVYVCLQSLRVIESFFCFLHLLFSKNPKTFAYHNALHFALCIVLALDLDLLWSTSQDFIQENLHSSFEEEIVHFTQQHTLFTWTQCICIDCYGVHFTSCCVITPLVARPYPIFE